MRFSTLVVVLVLLGLAWSQKQRSSAWQKAQDSLDEFLAAGANGQVEQSAFSMCHLSNEELMATAQATATQVLTGICSPDELDERFTALEDQITSLKDLVSALDAKLAQQEINGKKQFRRLLGSILTVLRNNLNNNNGKSKASSSSACKEDDDDDEPPVMSPPSSVVTTSRQMEIENFNSSVHTLQTGEQVFTYYWRVDRMREKMHSWSEVQSLRSPSFYIFPGGYRMYIRLYPRQSGQNIYIHVGLTKGTYDNDLAWPFRLLHRVSVLDRPDRENEADDILSRIWDPQELCSGWNWRQPRPLDEDKDVTVNRDNYECVGLGFAHDVALSRHYLRENSLIIKLTVFLEIK